MWSNVASTNEAVAGLKKFYTYLVEIGLVEAEDYREFLAQVKSAMPEWLGHYRDFEAW
jgi:GTP1/Obg family GTP-binding protein